MKRLLLLIIAALLMNTLQAQTSKVNVTIDGPGVVDEYLTVGTDGTKQLKLKAVPSKFLGDVTFDGWIGDATGMSEELIVSPDKAQNIHATFTYHRPTKKYPLLNLKQSWADMGKPMYVEAPGLFEREEAGQGRGYAYLPVDYNRDGILDYIEFAKKGGMGIDNHRENVRFWLGQSDGSIDEDPKNDNRMLGTVYSIMVKYADFNDDGYPDFCSFSSGYDRDGSTGDYPVVLMSSPEGVYTDLRFTDYNHGYFHGGTTGDIDNDGDIDILFWDMWHGDGINSLFLINDGKGNFTEVVATEILDLHSLTEIFGDTSLYMDMEVSDLNNDGYNDLFMLCNDHMSNTSGYINPPVIFWGSESGKFSADNATQLPATNRLGYGIGVGFIVYDLNGDGVKEVIVNRCGDGDYGGTTFYVGNYFQICEKEGDHYVDKTDFYFPKEHEAFNEFASETRTWIEEVDGIPYLCTGGGGDYGYLSGVGVGPQKLYSINNGILEPVEGKTQTRYASYDEGIPIYVDGPAIVEQYYYDDGVNPIDTMAEHRWVGTTEGDEYWGDAFSGGGSGNLWRINLHHRKDTHFGRTCIRWNRDGLDPSKKYESQFISFGFISDIDIQKLADEDYYLEFYIKNSDPDLTLNISFETYTENGNGGVDGTSFKGLATTMSKRNVDGGTFTGEWQRVIIPLSAFGGDASFSKVKNFNIRIGDGDFNNEFYLDDIRIRKISSVSFDDNERAFEKGYLAATYRNKVLTAQVQSQEFKAMLKSLIGKFAPSSMEYFNEYITDYDEPLTRGMATIMAYYVARSIGAEYQNATNDFPDDMWDGNFAGYDELLPHWNDPGEDNYPEGMWWRSTDFGGYQTPWLWNLCHVSSFSGKEVIALDKKAKTFHWDDPLTWEDAICAITRLYDSLDPELIKTMPETISISSAKQVPYCSDKNLDFTDLPDLKAYVATGYDKAKGTIWLTRVKEVPAETGFLLIGDPGDYDIPTIAGISDVYYKNMFKGTLTGTTIQTTDGDYTNYYLSNGTSGVGFYKVTSADGQKIGANRCYLPILTDIPAEGSEGDAEVIKVTAAKQVPYYTSKNVDFTSLDAQGVKAYTATGYNYGTGVIWLTRVKKVPAKTGVLIIANEAGEYSVPTTSVQSIYENMFVGSETAQTIYTNEEIGSVDYVNYYLSKGDAGVGFYKVTNEDGVKMGANRCYLPIPKRDAASGARGKNSEDAFCKMILSDESNDDVIAIPLFTDGTTGISPQFQDAEPDVYYNLQGQRVQNPSKGLYIRNGHKVVIK